MNRTPILQVKNVSKSFGKKKVLQDISFDLYEGEILGLFGGSGTGKSVILKCLIGLEGIDSGEIIFEGRDISKLRESRLIDVRKKIAYVFQNGALFDSLTVEQNLAYPLKEHTRLSEGDIQAKVNGMLELIDMKGSNNLLPAELSGGMQKRAGLARAIILNPKIVLFDEPTAGLDPVNTKRLVENLKKLKSLGMTGIFVTHDIPSAFEVTDRIAILYQGKIHTIDTVEHIRESKDPLVQDFIQGSIENSQWSGLSSGSSTAQGGHR